MNYLAVYVTVYEHKGEIYRGYTREFLRHSGIVVDNGDHSFDVFHVTGTPGIGLTFHRVCNWKDPRQDTARLLSMDFVAWIPQNRYSELEPLLKGVDIKVSRTWNCQNWVREGLDAMVTARLISEAEKNAAVQKQMAAVTRPFTTETPNAQALKDS
ncbi:hypothetical protein BU26DRAFT_558029 [Trematosphaeria pertusa]|uniref:Uncharacterized protein n=1 Tax=Trematosphaeria pertusa TaxID=390896 RepID=A0A6A6J1Y2_9PLEO|nr:uncharacterized protein BU26DRAFT_558029 [Trematosphaeria pertusa]KAF2256578.1 hypothetical protein BU26DRAFT_558029 [Trematosphaeria pertusa]